MKSKIIFTVVGIIILIVLNSINQSSNDNNTMSDSNNKIISENKKATIGFYNVENLFDIYDDPKTFDEDFTPYGKLKWDKERYEKKISDISSVISKLSNNKAPALIGLAEIENYDVMADLIKSNDLKGTNYKIIHRDNQDSRGIDVAAIYNADVFNKTKHTYYIVEEAHTRDILHIEGEFINNEKIHIFITHWPSRRKGTEETEYKRINVAKLLRSKIDNLLDRNPDERIIIMGDFNDEPSNNSISNYLMKSEFYNLHQKFDGKDNGTVNFRGDWMIFDQIIVSNSLLNDNKYSVERKGGKIYTNKDITFTHRDGNTVPSRTYGGPKYYGGTSDHYPVYVDLKLN